MAEDAALRFREVVVVSGLDRAAIFCGEFAVSERDLAVYDYEIDSGRELIRVFYRRIAANRLRIKHGQICYGTVFQHATIFQCRLHDAAR